MTDSVSRETPPAPDVAAGVFSHALPLAEQFARLLVEEGVLRGLIGPREVPRIWERHLINCALLGEAIGEHLEVCDVGSGAGLPGMVLALSRPDLRVTLVEPLLRRTTFLEEAVVALGLTNVEVVRSRAEELHGKRDFDIVTSRAVAPLDRLLAWSMPLVRHGGALVAMKGSSVQEELAEADKALRKYGAGSVTVTEYGAGLVERPTTVVRVEATKPSRLGWDSASPPRTKKSRRSSAVRRRDR